MKKFGSWMLLALFVGSVLTSCTASKKDSDVIQIGFIPAEASDKVAANGKVLTALLEKQTGMKFNTYVATDYTALVESMRSDQVQVGFLAPFAFVLAEKNVNAKVLLKSVRYGAAVQYSAIIVKDSSPIKKLEDLKGKTVAWVDPSSSSGHIAPKSSLIAKGVNPDEFFSKQTWAGSHEALVISVANGTVDAGATFSNDQEGSSGAWTKFAKSLGDKAPKFRAVFVTPPMPSDTVSVSGGFAEKSPEKVAKIKEALMALTQSPEGKEALKNLYGIEGFVEAKSEEFEVLRKGAAALGYSLGGK